MLPDVPLHLKLAPVAIARRDFFENDSHKPNQPNEEHGEKHPQTKIRDYHRQERA